MTSEEPSFDWDGLLFGVRRSVRYHSRREAFFSASHRFTSFLSVTFGSATVTALLSNLKIGGLENVAVVLALVVTLAGAMDLVLAFSEKARIHSDLKRRFIDIEACMAATPSSRLYEKCWRRRLKIEADEPPKLTALDLLCHNELLDATGYTRSDSDEKALYRFVPWWQHATANLWPWNGPHLSLAEHEAKRSSGFLSKLRATRPIAGS